MNELTPPIEYYPITHHEDFDDHEVMDRVELAIIDSLGNQFTLTIETEQENRDRLDEDARTGVESDGEEPVYLVQEHEIRPALIDQIVQMDPEILQPYLVPQEPEEPNPAAA